MFVGVEKLVVFVVVGEIYGETFRDKFVFDLFGKVFFVFNK